MRRGSILLQDQIVSSYNTGGISSSVIGRSFIKNLVYRLPFTIPS